MTALPKTRRRIFFYLSLLVFFVTAPLILLYALGYRVNIEQREVEETGGLFIKTNITGFTVSLNDGAIQKSSLLTRGLLLNNLVPGQYRLRVEKTGYQPWEKIVSVTPFSVREIRNIILLPDPLQKKEIVSWNKEEQPERVFVSPEGHDTAVVLRNTETRTRALIFFNTAEERIRARFPLMSSVEEVTWNAARSTALVTISGQYKTYFLVSVSDISPRRTPLLKTSITIAGNTKNRLTETEIKKVRFGNEINSFVMLDNAGTLLLWNTPTTSAAILAEGVEEFEMLSKDVFFIAKNGFAVRQSLRDNTTINLGRKGYALAETPIMVVRSQQGDMFLKDGANGLFFSSRGNTEEFELIETGVHTIALDSEEKKLFFIKQNAIGVFYIEDNRYQPFEKRGAKTILFESRDTTFLDAVWYTEDDAHIILNTSSGIFLLDIDTRGGPRIAELDSKAAEKIFWNQDEKKLYLIRDGGIETLAIE